MIGIRENYLQLSLGQGTSVYLILVSNSQDHSTVEGELTDNVENAILPLRKGSFLIPSAMRFIFNRFFMNIYLEKVTKRQFPLEIVCLAYRQGMDPVFLVIFLNL